MIGVVVYILYAVAFWALVFLHCVLIMELNMPMGRLIGNCQKWSSRKYHH